MRKLYVCIATAIALSAAPAFSANTPAPATDTKTTEPSYSSTQHPQAKKDVMTAKSMVTMPTDITVVNGSVSPIYVTVPFSPIYDILYPGNNDHIFHPQKYDDTHLVLQDSNHITFYDNYVCRHAVVTVFGQPGAYRINVDTAYCW